MCLCEFYCGRCSTCTMLWFLDCWWLWWMVRCARWFSKHSSDRPRLPRSSDSVCAPWLRTNWRTSGSATWSPWSGELFNVHHHSWTYARASHSQRQIHPPYPCICVCIFLLGEQPSIRRIAVFLHTANTYGDWGIELFVYIYTINSG